MDDTKQGRDVCLSEVSLLKARTAGLKLKLIKLAEDLLKVDNSSDRIRIERRIHILREVIETLKG